MTGTYDLFLVALSYVVSVLGSYVALQLATGIPSSSGRNFWMWLLGAALALGGGGIWTMHFIGMLAYKLPMAVTFDFPLTFLSLLLAIAVVGFGFFIVGRSNGRLSMLLLAGLVTGLGVATMHYSGMAAMNMGGEMAYNMTIVYLSIVIAVAASVVALWLAFNLRGNLQRFASALVMGVAVCGMHYTGMAAMSVEGHSEAMAMSTAAQTGMSSQMLAIWVFAGAVVVILGLFFASMKQAQAAQSFVYKSMS